MLADGKNIIAQCRKTVDFPVDAAYDGMVVEL
jgi:hypothetical protein